MAATGVAAVVGGAIAGMPAPTDCVAGDGSTCGSCHGSDWGRGSSGGCDRRHAGSHRVPSRACRLPQIAGLAMAAVVGAAMAATGVAAVAEGAIAGMPAPTDCMTGDGSSCGSCHGSDQSRGSSGRCRRRHAGSHRLHGWRWQQVLTVGAAMAATGVAAVVEGAIAGMPAPTGCGRGHAGSHRLHGWRWQHLWELPWQRLGSRL